MCLQAWETVEVEAVSAMQLNAEHRSGSCVLPLVTIMIRNSVDVEYRDGVVKLLRINTTVKNDTVAVVTVFATNELPSRVVAVKTQVDPKAIAIARKSDVPKIRCARGSSFVATDENDTQLGHLTPVLCMARNPSNAIIFAGHSSGMLTTWTSNMPSPAVALVAYSGVITAVAVTESGSTPQHTASIRRFCSSRSLVSTSRRRNRIRAMASRRSHRTASRKSTLTSSGRSGTSSGSSGM